uniref:Uncharacterized protein n=2 Tax=Auxenochlorella protothecoides TaxID=3075 RepID=A0A1D2AGM1_AUXPR
MASTDGSGSPPGPGVTRAQAKESLRRLMMSLESLQRQVDTSLSHLSEVPRSDLASFLAVQREGFIASHREQMREWDALLGCEQEPGVSGSQPEDSKDTTPFGVSLRSLESRVTAMGGIPALGAGLVLPRMTPRNASSLAATASPAAVEVARARAAGGDSAPTPLLKTRLGGQPGGEAGTPSPFAVKLRPAGVGLPAPEERTGLQKPDLQADFAAAMQRRRAAQEAAAQ